MNSDTKSMLKKLRRAGESERMTIQYIFSQNKTIIQTYIITPRVLDTYFTTRLRHRTHNTSQIPDIDSHH